ncbi:ABC-type transport auxiliary lipoprotein family protein [Deltaproteobacteria bacterium OttesenSCG-928-K17]|nr:ABC-type transport auxiliary lipoprotein family protein [Deltaproteobacteria bacterium OttesenSCG-928-K17]
MKIIGKIIPLAILAALLGLSGCMTKAHPEKNQYGLSVGPPAREVPASANRRTLLIGNVTAAAGYDNRAMVYKVGADKYESDFYNEYLAPPARLLADQASQYLDRANRKVRVVKTPGLTLAQYGLETYIEALYGDYTAGPPQAVVRIRFTLNDLRGSSPKVMLDQTYAAQSPMADQSPAALAEAAGAALEEILASLNGDIEAVIGQ